MVSVVSCSLSEDEGNMVIGTVGIIDDPTVASVLPKIPEDEVGTVPMTVERVGGDVIPSIVLNESVEISERELRAEEEVGASAVGKGNSIED